MVRRAALLLLVLSLAGCGFFTASLFPGYLAQAEKSYELGSGIDGFLAGLGGSGYRWYPQVFVLTSNAGVDYGGVLIEIDSLPYKLLLLADPAGKVQQLPDPGFGRLQLRAADNRFVVGKYQFLPDALATDAPTGVTGDYPGFANSSNNFLLWTGGTYSLNYTRYSPSWTTPTTKTISIDTFGSFDLRGVYFDPGAALDREVILALLDFSSNRVLVIFTPIARFVDDAFPIQLTTYPYLQFDNVDVNNVIYTRKGIVLVDNDGNAALMDLSGRDTGKNLDLGQGGEVRVAFDLEGDTFYVFNPEDQRLYRGRTGW